MTFWLGLFFLFAASITAGDAIGSFSAGVAVFCGGLFLWIIWK